MAMASSIPPSHASFFWKTCMSTRGWRPSCSSVARAWLKYASVYQPARIFSTGRSKTAGSRRAFVLLVAMLEREAGREGRFGDLQLRLGRLRRRKAVLDLMARLRQRLRHRVAGVTRHPAEELGGRSDGADLRDGPGGRTEARRREAREDVADARRQQHRADEMTAAA